MTRREVPVFWIVAATSLWLAVVTNWPLWREMRALGLLERPGGWTIAVLAGCLITLLLMALLSLLAWRRVLVPVVVLLLLAGAAGAHFMASYGIVIDPGMLRNVVQTDWREAGALLNPRLLLTLAVLAGIPLLVLSRVRMRSVAWKPAALRNTASAFASLVLAALVLVIGFQPLASAMRNHKQLRYMVNPLNTVYALGSIAAQPLRNAPKPMLPVGLDARVADRGERPPLLLLVLGETARSANFGLNGYARDTTPELAKEDVVSFRNAWSCGTSTAASVPCMFSPLGRDAFEGRSQDTENLLDVLRRAGMAVLWVDNQSGCKGVCDRVTSVNVAGEKDPALCATGECLDAILLKNLDERIAALPPAQRAKGVVVVMHQMGSHGPAYYLRSPADRKRFTPECTQSDLPACSREQIVNAYDNSIAYTDHVLAGGIRWLREREAQWDGGMLYLSDHGESLGENNLYLHGLPYSLAPDVQKHVPWITWASAGLRQRTGLDMNCLRANAGTRVSHDNLFHSVLGLMQVRTAVYHAALDAYAECGTKSTTN